MSFPLITNDGWTLVEYNERPPTEIEARFGRLLLDHDHAADNDGNLSLRPALESGQPLWVLVTTFVERNNYGVERVRSGCRSGGYGPKPSAPDPGLYALIRDPSKGYSNRNGMDGFRGGPIHPESVEALPDGSCAATAELPLTRGGERGDGAIGDLRRENRESKPQVVSRRYLIDATKSVRPHTNVAKWLGCVLDIPVETARNLLYKDWYPLSPERANQWAYALQLHIDHKIAPIWQHLMAAASDSATAPQLREVASSSTREPVSYGITHFRNRAVTFPQEIENPVQRTLSCGSPEGHLREGEDRTARRY